MSSNNFVSAIVLAVLSDYWVLKNLSHQHKPIFFGNEHLVTILEKVLSHNGIKSTKSILMDTVTLDFGTEENYNSVDAFFFSTIPLRKQFKIPEMNFAPQFNISTDNVAYKYFQNLEEFFFPDSKHMLEIPCFQDGVYRYFICDTKSSSVTEK